MVSWFRKLNPSSKLFIFTTLFHGLFLIAIEIFGIVEYSNKDEIDSNYIKFYSILFFLSVFFGAIFAFIIIYQENIFQLFSFQIAICLLVFYSIYEFATGEKNARLYVLLIVNCAYFIYYFFILKILYHNFQWNFWNKAGASISIQRLYKYWNLFLNLIGVDLLVNITLLIGALYFLFGEADYERYLDIVGLIITIFWFFLGFHAYKKEVKKLILVFFFLGLLEPIYLIAKLILFNTDERKKYKEKPIITIEVMIAISLFVRTLLLVISLIGMLNFGNGLKEKLTPNYFSTSLSDDFFPEPLIKKDEKTDSDPENDDDDEDKDKDKHEKEKDNQIQIQNQTQNENQNQNINEIPNENQIN
ncbi:hypothetical protein M0811_14379 [Anaeramoeba ignava]|uniref:DUF7789 domain-containing protein n=1 Tax=Anaeramoeba ignava TaxID=1746090 RepID=A0A9Q0RG18_ANAIG|nr:hypothetical protein M0811_14379 [Anaeramoeba ignava]